MFVSFVFVFASCDKKTLEPQAFATPNGFRTEDEPDKTSKVKYNGEFLVFEDPKEFDSLVKKLANAKQEEWIKWQSQFSNFQSMRRIYDRARAAQEFFLDSITKLSREQQEAIVKQKQHKNLFASLVLVPAFFPTFTANISL